MPEKATLFSFGYFRRQFLCYKGRQSTEQTMPNNSGAAIKNNNNKRGTLHERTLELLKASDKTNIQIYDATGIPYHWVSSFRLGKKAKNPSVNRVQKLYEFLSGKILTL